VNVRYLDEDTISDESELTKQGLQVSASSGSNTIVQHAAQLL
jgi:hypothetical protein